MTSAIRDLRLMNAAVAQSNITDYKALVCIFLAGRQRFQQSHPADSPVRV